MDILQKVHTWLDGNFGPVTAVDVLPLMPGSCSLFPIGQQQLACTEDVLGNKKRQLRYRFLIRWAAAPGTDAARRMLLLQQQALQKPPVLGAQQQFYAENGKLEKTASTGVGIYCALLTAEFTKEEEHG